MRICVFTPTFFPTMGGAEVVVDALARQFTLHGHDAVVLTPRVGDGPGKGLPYAVAHYRKPMLPQWFPERISSALKRLHRQRPLDVVLALYGQPTGYAAIRARQRTGVPVVLRCPGGDLYRHGRTRRHPHRWRRVVAAYRQADAVVAISPYIEQLIREVVPEARRLTQIPNGVDAEAIRAPAEPPADLPTHRPFCLCLGNLIAQKGFDDAINAFADAGEAIAGLDMIVVGQGKLGEALRQQADARGLAGRVHFLGQRTGNDKRWLLQNCRFGVMPSREEAFGIVALEFLAAGKPLLCSQSPAFDAMYEHEVNGLRVEAGDVPALASGMTRLWRGELADVAAVNARRLEPFNWPAVAQRYLELLEAVCAR